MNTRTSFLPGKHLLAHKLRAHGVRLGQAVDLSLVEGGFRCVHCRSYVSVDDRLSGVGNRNHCPYCLWSRHLDLKKAGDRLSACKSGMQPVGLALKRSRDKYAARGSGELMLIHRCSGCGKLSLNRIAADDDPEHVLGALDTWRHLQGELREGLQQDGIAALERGDSWQVRQQLYGELGRAE